MVRQATADNLEESDDLDWKEMLPQPPRDGRWNEFAKDVAAMANTRGGLIIFGVQDKTTVLTGIAPDEVNRQQYAQWIRNHVQPYLPDLDIFELTDGTKTVLVVDVPASEMAPHFVYGGAARATRNSRPRSSPTGTTTTPPGWQSTRSSGPTATASPASAGQRKKFSATSSAPPRPSPRTPTRPLHGSSRSPGLSGPCRAVPTR